MRVVAVVTCLLISGGAASCGSTSKPAPRQLGLRSPPSLTFASPAERYNDPTEPPPSTSLGDLLLGSVRDAAARAGRPNPVADERLFLAAAALATVIPEDGQVPYRLVEFTMHTNGVIEPSPHMLVLWGALDEPGRGGIDASLRPSLDALFRGGEFARVGVAAVVRARHGHGAIGPHRAAEHAAQTDLGRGNPLRRGGRVRRPRG